MKLAGQDLDALRTGAASRDFQPVPLGLKAKLDLKSELKRVNAPNVVGILQGSEPNLIQAMNLRAASKRFTISDFMNHD